MRACWAAARGVQAWLAGAAAAALVAGDALAWDPAPLDLGRTAFVHNGAELDRDGDGLFDALEHRLASEFAPRLIFDSSEHHRRDNEPVTLFQVRPSGCIGQGCPGGAGTLLVRYVFLFQTDGGYGPSSDCKDAHNGDNQALDLHLASRDGRVWDVARIDNSRFHATWAALPGGGDGRHVEIYMSAHKHHQYFGTANDGRNSPYSSFGCNDDVNGRGARVSPPLHGEFCWRQSDAGGVGRTACRTGPLNAGEPEAHDPAHFVGDLSSFGFPDEHAWSNKPFKGGLGDDGKDTSSVGQMWSRGEVRRAVGFERYTAFEHIAGAVQVPLHGR